MVDDRTVERALNLPSDLWKLTALAFCSIRSQGSSGVRWHPVYTIKMESRQLHFTLTSGLLGLAIACGEIQHASYATYAAADSAGAVTRGWVPSFVPSTAIEIVEIHDLDLNTQRLRFRAPEADLRTMIATLVPLSLDEARKPGIEAPPLPGDWPFELFRGPLVATPRGTLRMFRTQLQAPGASCIAVEWSRRIVYAWSCAVPAT